MKKQWDTKVMVEVAIAALAMILACYGCFGDPGWLGDLRNGADLVVSLRHG